MAGIAAAMVFAADPAFAAGTVIGGVSTLLGLLATVWAVMVARGSPLAADGAAAWVVGGAVLGTAGWAGRRVVIDRMVGWWRHGLRRWPEVRRIVGDTSARSAAGSPTSTLPAASVSPLIRRCPERLWPDGFDRDRVLTDARRCFVALQAAWDAHDLAALAELTTPNMLVELRDMLEARSGTPNRTDVLTLDAELLCIEAIGLSWCASIEFSGFIRESAVDPAAPFRELWMLASPKDGAVRWRLARQQALL